jgi:HEAT repeat protein
MKDPWRLEAIFKQLNDPKRPSSEKSQILHCLNSEQDARIIPTLEKLLESRDNPDLIRSVIQTLSWGNSPKAAPILRKQLDRKDLDPKVRRTARIGLVQLGHESITPKEITQLIEDPELDSGDLSRILSGLGRRDPTPHLEALRKRLEDQSSTSMASQIIRFLCRHQDRKLLTKLPPFLESENAPLSRVAFEALVELGGDKTVPRLQSLLLHKELREEIRVLAATALLQREDFSGLSLLLESLKSPQVESRRQAIQSLGKLPIRATLLPLLERLDDEDLVVRTEALAAIRSILDNLFPYKHFRWKQLGYNPSTSPSPERRQAIKILKHWLEQHSRR